jgi:hypothetical protein
MARRGRRATVSGDAAPWAPAGRLHGHGGFTLIEITIVGVMMTFLAVVFSMAWSGLGQPSADALVRCQVGQEARLAAACLAADLGGSLPGQGTGPVGLGKMVGRMVVGGAELWLCFDGGSPNAAADWGSPDTVITYAVEDGKLVRTNQAASTAFVVASNVTAMGVEEQGTGARIQLTFSFRDVERTYTLITVDP